MLTIDIKEAETNFEKYVKLLEDKKEKEIIISIDGNPTIVLLPYTKQRKRVFGSAKGKISVPDDFDDIDIFENAQKWARVAKTLDIKEGDTLTIKELNDSINISKKKDDTVEDILCAFYNKPIEDILKMKIKDKDTIVDFGDDVGDEIL